MNRITGWLIFLGVAGLLSWGVVKASRLPSELINQIQEEKTLLASAHGTLDGDRNTISKQAAADPELFAVQGFDHVWPARLGEAGAALTEADRYAVRLEALRQHNQKSTRPEVEDLLRRERERIGVALTAAGGVVTEARKRADLKLHFPQTLDQIETQAKSLESADLTEVTAKVHKAELDWPSRKEDLETRLNAVLNAKKQAAEWEHEAEALKTKPAAQLTAKDYAQALDAEESLDRFHGEAAGKSLAGLSQQLYVSWDNVLEDLDQSHGVYRERIKHISTVVPAPGAKGETSSSVAWQDVPQEQWKLVENDLGMTIAHKPLGKFDSEADLTAEPPGFAYMASPQEGRNQYGYWDHSGGGSFWHWLPEYLILRELLWNHNYQPVPMYDWNRYSQARSSGQTWFGQDASGAPRYGTHGTFTAQHYGNSRYVQSGGFGSSRFASGARPAAPAPGQRFGAPSGDAGGRKFGGTPAGRSFGAGARPAGRSFGRRH
jgi:hypothetical protein